MELRNGELGRGFPKMDVDADGGFGETAYG